MRITKFLFIGSCISTTLMAIWYVAAMLGSRPFASPAQFAPAVSVAMILHMFLILPAGSTMFPPYATYGPLVRVTSRRLVVARFALASALISCVGHFVGRAAFPNSRLGTPDADINILGPTFLVSAGVYAIVAYGLGLQAVFGRPSRRWINMTHGTWGDDKPPARK